MINIAIFTIGFCAGAITVITWLLCKATKLDEERREHHEEQRRLSGSDSKPCNQRSTLGRTPENEREKKYGIKRGETIELKFAERQEDGKNIRIRTRKMKVIKLYEHHVILESPKGIRECMGYWKLDRCLSKTGGDSLET